MRIKSMALGGLGVSGEKRHETIVYWAPSKAKSYTAIETHPVIYRDGKMIQQARVEVDYFGTVEEGEKRIK